MKSAEVPRKNRVPYPAVVAVLAVCLLLLRAVPRLRHPGFYAEDGQIFLAQAHNSGAAAFWEPYAGYLHLIPRVIAAVLEPLPVTAAPVLYAAAALMVHVAMLSPALSPRLDWIIPGQFLRSVLFALLCLMPPLWEVLGNVANLIFVGGITLLLLMLSDDPTSRVGRLGELAAVAALGLSGPLIAFFVPWFIWRWRRTRSRHGLAVVAVAVAAALVQALIFVFSDRQGAGGRLLYLPRVWVERIGLDWLFGDSQLLGSPWWVACWLAALVWCVGAVVITIVVLRRTAVALWLLHFALLAAPVMAYGYMPPPFTWQRHFVVPTAIVIVLLVAVIGARRWAVAAGVWLLVGAGAMAHDFAPAPYPYRPDLTALQQCVTRGEPVCRQTIFGNGWSIELRR
ncbi:hypothetical protein [Mycobacterium sp.]|uniref:hypothetical protein n=1 Tax=Mycobacterium sp. TaxID=1785 RepID=UPI0025FA4902|nr:hypothetical protein [Mycobacterium sp.]MBW0012061.1 hypothetical protein [Mycobacterium sp.]